MLNGHQHPIPDQKIAFAVTRAAEGGYVITTGDGAFAAARSSLGEVCQWMGGKLGGTFNESPYMPQVHAPVIQSPPARMPSVPPVPAPQYHAPASEEAYPPIPNGILPGSPEDDQSVAGMTRKLADRLPRVAAHVMAICLATYGLWPFGA